jgi:hypothetical protein
MKAERSSAFIYLGLPFLLSVRRREAPPHTIWALICPDTNYVENCLLVSRWWDICAISIAGVQDHMSSKESDID